MNIGYRVDPDETEPAQLTKILSGGKQAARRIKQAQILLAADVGISDEEIIPPDQRPALIAARTPGFSKRRRKHHDPVARYRPRCRLLRRPQH